MTRHEGKIYFATHEVTAQVFLTTPHSFALVNLKPLLPGHVLICPLTAHKRLTDLSTTETTDLFQTVQKVQRLLARYYFRKISPASAPASNSPGASKTYPPPPPNGPNSDPLPVPEDGSFNIAIQDGAEAGQTVPHVHVHVLPRIRDVSAKDTTGEGDEVYEMMAREEGNVGGALWDRDVGRIKAGVGGGFVGEGEWDERLGRRPVPGGSFPKVEDCLREARSVEEMVREAEVYRGVLREMDGENEENGENGEKESRAAL